jgi:DNA-binding transcriptional LysR family regulator
MDINLARTFLEIAKTGTFVGAAANLNLTQTAVSARIRMLEQQLDRTLYIRNKAGARLTPAGEQFFRFATSLVQIWDRARTTVALAAGRSTVVVIGVEFSQWSPLMRHWLLWMRRECPDIAVSVHVSTADRLMEQVQEGALDIAILYAAPHRPGIVAELLFEERLVLVTTMAAGQAIEAEDWVHVDWGEEFEASFRAAFPDIGPGLVTIDYGPMALDYMLAQGGAGYFRMGLVRPLVDQGRLQLVPDSPEFSYPSYIVHSANADESVMAEVRRGLRAAAASSL